MIEHEYWMQTFTGLAFDYINPKPEQVSLEDIAHHLATAAIRFNGASREPYPVAQHSVWVADYVRAKHAEGPHALILNPWTGEEKVIDRAPWTEMAGLMHDTPEAYTGDAVRPWKKLLLVQLNGPERGSWSVGEAEARYLNVILRKLAPELVKIYEGIRFGNVVRAFDHEQVKMADTAALATERRDLVGPPAQDQPWVDGKVEPWGPEIVPLPWRDAKDLFLHRFDELKAAMEAA